MIYGILITDGGPHSADKWAVATAERVFPIDDKVDGDRMVQARGVQQKVVEALLPHHKTAQTTTATRLSESTPESETESESETAANDALTSVISAIAGSPWQSKTDDPDWRALVKSIIHSHFQTVRQIARQWHEDRSKN